MHTNTLTIPVSDETLQALQRQADADGIDVETVAALALMVGVHGVAETESMFSRLLASHVPQNFGAPTETSKTRNAGE